MQLKHRLPPLLFALMVNNVATADVTDQDFVAKKTRNIINLCTASPQDPHYREAVHFCQGYLIGAFHFYAAQAANTPAFQMVCFPEPKPTRNEAIDQFVSWTQKHPEYMDELPVETEFRFLTEKWPCKQ